MRYRQIQRWVKKRWAKKRHIDSCVVGMEVAVNWEFQVLVTRRLFFSVLGTRLSRGARGTAYSCWLSRRCLSAGSPCQTFLVFAVSFLPLRLEPWCSRQRPIFHPILSLSIPPNFPSLSFFLLFFNYIFTITLMNRFRIVLSG